MIKPIRKQDKVIAYFNSLESRLGYKIFLKGRKHFGFYPTNNTDISIKDAQIKMEDLLAKSLVLKKGETILDAGCGEGWVAIYLAQKYKCKVIGVDLLDWAVEKANKNAIDQGVSDLVKFQQMDYTKLDFPDKTFNAVYTMETLVHVPDHMAALKHFYRVLKPKGRVALFEYSIQPDEQLSNTDKSIKKMIIEGSAMHSLPFFLHNSFPDWLKKAGFKNIKVQDITSHVIPLVKIFHDTALLPYQIIKLFKLQKKFVNATCSVEWYRLIQKGDFWRYNIVTAIKN
jgi:sterol 24-C-methyltransferase